MTKPLVSIVRAGEDVERAVRKAVALAGGVDDIVTTASRVLVKPNIANRE
jgi:uncharacterized protein (DUF362 family)